MTSATEQRLAPRLRLRRRPTSTDVFCLLLLAALVTRICLSTAVSSEVVSAWTTVFAAICIQAAPFLVLGIIISTAIAVFVPPSFFRRALPTRTALAVPVAGVAGCALLGCECGSVPVAASLMQRGVARGPAVAFLVAAPAINPVVLVATAVAFPGEPVMVLGRFVASLAAAVIVGWMWQWLGRQVPIPRRFSAPDDADRATRARMTASHDLAQALGLLVVGAAAAATLNTVVPHTWLDRLGGSPALGVVLLSGLAVLLAVCSEADAFIAASLTQFSLTARLAFMVVGPAVDVKLIAMHIGTFGRRFAVRFAPLTLVVAGACAAAAGTLLL